MEIALVLLITAGAVYLFVTEKFRSDLVALVVLGALVLVGLAGKLGSWLAAGKWISPEEGVSGFSNPATITVAAMFVLSAGLQKTGAVAIVGRLLGRLGRWPWLMLVVMMSLVGLVSGFINNTAAVAIFLPPVMAACARNRVSPSRFLIPLSYAAQFGGSCTLIGTSTNLLVSAVSAGAGHGAFNMFEFTRLGLVLLGAGIVYVTLIGHWLLPERRGAQLLEAYQLGEYITELRVLPESPLIGKTVAQSKFGQNQDVTLLEVLRPPQTIFAPLYEPLRAGDLLLVRSSVPALIELKTAWKLEMEPEFQLKDEALQARDLRLAEVLVAPRSDLLHRTLPEVDFRRRYNAIVLAIQRRDETARERLNQVRLRFGDALLLLAPAEEIARLRSDPNLLLLEQAGEPVLRRRRIPVALAIFAAVVALPALNLMPILASSIFGCIALVMTRCLTLEEAYAAIDWKVIFLLAGVLPLGLAVQKSGAASWLAQSTLDLFGQFGPVVVLAALYLITAVLTEFMSNNATAVLLSPIAISAATVLSVDPRPFLMAVCFAASTSFSTPVGYQTNAMVQHPGGYRFTDYLRIGLPLNLLFWALAVWFIPRIWKF
jgi:di/tricarboxylate transporter